MRPERIFYFASTHWDREWYRTVDEFRFRLVPVLDKVIRTLEGDPSFERFTLDGQTCPLEDYLAVRPERRRDLERLIRDGRLLVGPWYTMPDEHLVSGESLIQNLLAGHALAEEFGGTVLENGYVCDTFGHIANLPQILSGFGIYSALISRGTNDFELECFFRWRSPDGSQIAVFKTPESCGYGSFYWEALHPFRPNYTEHLDEITGLAAAYVERELHRTSLPKVILMDGMDHETIHEFMPLILARLAERFGCPVEQERLDRILGDAGESTPLVSGELNSHCRDNVKHNKLIPHTLSSRYDLKRANDMCQNLLERRAMPAAALLRLRGLEADEAFITYAYRLLLKNHAHDSICGCSVDAVHREMMVRFEKAARTAGAYFSRFCALEYDPAGEAGDETVVKVFNPLPYEYRGALELDIDFDGDFPVKELVNVKYEQRNAFLIYNEEGRMLPYDLIRAARGDHISLPNGNYGTADTHTVSLEAVLRPMAFTGFSIRPTHRPYRNLERFSTGPRSCENELISFLIHPDGTIRITDKASGAVFDGMHSFLDCAETGDGWFHIRPIQDRLISSPGCPVSVEKTLDGRAACKFLVRYAWSLPEEAVRERDFTRRSGNYVPFTVESEFTVFRRSRLVAVKTTVHNTVRDHRLQLHLPTGTGFSEYFVDQCGLILRRQAGLDTSRCDWKEADITEYPFESMVFTREGGRGLLFISGGGLHEVSCPGDSAGSVDITLLRCFSKTAGTDGEPDGQLQGRQVFTYALVPISGETDAELVRMKDRFTCGYPAFTVPEGRALPPSPGFTLRSEHCVYNTCMPAKTGGILIRLTNYAGESDACTLILDREIGEACLCDFLENPTEPLSVRGREVSFRLPAYKIATIRLLPKT